MSRFFPHSAYAEDQPFSHAILTTHVLSRGFTLGAFAGSLFALGSSAYFMKGLSPSLLLRHAGVGSVVGTGLLSVGLAARMRGREPIEWNDRSWRLLENKGQVEVDDWSYGGAILGTAATMLARTNPGWRGVVGGAGLGSLAGVCGYMALRRVRG